MSPIGRRHAACIKRLIALLSRPVEQIALLAIQNPMHLSDHAEPQPDALLLRSRPDYYADVPPGPTDVLLLIEVADTSLDYDRKAKTPLYARAGIPTYQHVRTLKKRETRTTTTLPDLTLVFDQLFA